MSVRARYLGVLVVAFVASYLGYRLHLPLRPAFSEIHVTIKGAFPEKGEFQGKPLAYAERLRRWGSFAGTDENTGQLELGPFPALHRLRFAYAGYPANPGNRIIVRRTDTGESVIPTLENAGEQWMSVDVDLPKTWEGHPVMLIAVDAATNPTGWLGVTEPLRGGIGEGDGALLESLACWLLNGLVFGGVWLVAHDLVLRRGWVALHWSPLVAAGFVATLGYALFWITFASPAAGRIAAFTVLGAGILFGWRPGQSRGGAALHWNREATTNVLLLFAIGFLYLTLLHLFPTTSNFYQLAATRYQPALPADNRLPHDLAIDLSLGRTLRPPGADWLTSDRPPLQAGCLLFALPIGSLFGLDQASVTGTAAVWLQLLWIPAAYGLFRTLGVSPHSTARWLLLLALTGFFVQNSIFTWPKLMSGAFGCGAFGIWIVPRSGGRWNSDYALGALLAALAWLAHGGIAFSFVALLPWISWRMVRGDARPWTVAAAIFLLFSLPWLAFQKGYNPPGDRLIKWHLGGKPEKDPRNAWTVIRTAYAEESVATIVDNKVKNFIVLAYGPWPPLFSFTSAAAPERRNEEFFCVLRALTWWLAAPIIGILAWAVRPIRNLPTVAQLAVRQPSNALALWATATLVMWCLLMFGPYQCTIHQGSYATMIALFVLASTCMEHASRWWILPIGMLQLATYVTTWVGPNVSVHGNPEAWPFAAVGAIILAVLFTATFVTSDRNGTRP